jgi:hypothetical protein
MGSLLSFRDATPTRELMMVKDEPCPPLTLASFSQEFKWKARYDYEPSEETSIFF